MFLLVTSDVSIDSLGYLNQLFDLDIDVFLIQRPQKLLDGSLPLLPSSHTWLFIPISS